ncbi:MAG: signal peptide peptidase SppA [Elusimicrobia bacterium]|nr:signal peptide peptidase SppA [Elusimicrobiota bacterium]
MTDQPSDHVPAQPPSPAGGEQPSFAPLTSADHHLAGSRRVKRRLMFAVMGLYLLSLVAAAVVVFRAPAGGKGGKDSDGSESGLLSMTPKDTVGWISIHGAIYNEGTRLWDKASYQWARRLRMMAETKGVKAIILDINSPGGSVGAVQELYTQIRRIRKETKIPIIALFGDVAASGGYYIAAACDKIVAHPGTLTGSIGVIFSVSNLEGLFGKVGYKTDPIKSGRHKDIGSWSRAMTKEERDILQALIDDAYGQFLTAISTGRNMPVDKIKPLADGRIFTGMQALESGLVDVIGDSQDAIDLAAKLGGIVGKPKVRREIDPSKMFMELFESRLSIGSPSALLDELGLRLGAESRGMEYRWTGR